MKTLEQYAAEAQETYASCEIELDDDTLGPNPPEDHFSQSDDGCWVRAWLWVPGENDNEGDEDE
jgi:hypothetical protein